jgi:hypothetical protein
MRGKCRNVVLFIIFKNNFGFNFFKTCSEVGYFVNSIRPDVDTFRDSIKTMNEICEGKQNEEIYMYCTGKKLNNIFLIIYRHTTYRTCLKQVEFDVLKRVPYCSPMVLNQLTCLKEELQHMDDLL